MSEAAQLIVAVATLISSVAALVVGWRNTRKIKEVHDATNGLMKTMGDAREAKGFKEGAEQK